MVAYHQTIDGYAVKTRDLSTKEKVQKRENTWKRRGDRKALLREIERDYAAGEELLSPPWVFAKKIGVRRKERRDRRKIAQMIISE